MYLSHSIYFYILLQINFIDSDSGHFKIKITFGMDILPPVIVYTSHNPP